MRVQAYNSHFEAEVMKYKEPEKREMPDIEYDEEVGQTRGSILTKLTEWFGKSTPILYDGFQDKLLNGDMSDLFHEQIMVNLEKFNKNKEMEVFLTSISVANQLTNRFMREMVNVTKSYKMNIFNELSKDDLRSRLRVDFKEMIKTIIDIIITDHSLFSIVASKKELHLG